MVAARKKENQNRINDKLHLLFYGKEILQYHRQSKKISNDQELIQSDPISCPQNQKGNN